CSRVARRSKIHEGYSPSSRLAAAANLQQRTLFLFMRWVLVHGYDDFPSGMALLEIADRVGNFSQGFVSAINHWFQFPGLHHIGEDGEIFAVRVGHHHAHLLIDELGEHHRPKRFSQTAEKSLLVGAATPDDDVFPVGSYDGPALRQRMMHYIIKDPVLTFRALADV